MDTGNLSYCLSALFSLILVNVPLFAEALKFLQTAVYLIFFHLVVLERVVM